MEQISRFEFNESEGYRKAIMDIMEVFNYIIPDLKHYRISFTPKLQTRLLQVCLENRQNMRENLDKRGFIRWNPQKNDFEWFVGVK